jgi:hypothetical protein
MGVTYMDLRHEMAAARQQEMLAEAAAQRQALRARALARATRRVERAEYRLNRSMVHAMRLRARLAAGEGH